MKTFFIDELNTDEGYVRLKINERIYSKETIFAAGYVFLDRAYIYLDKDKESVLVYLIPQKKGEDLRKLGLEFSNELLNYSHYFTSAKANAEIVKTIMQRALFSASPSLSQESAADKELEDLIKELEQKEKVGRKKKK